MVSTIAARGLGGVGSGASSGVPLPHRVRSESGLALDQEGRWPGRSKLSWAGGRHCSGWPPRGRLPGGGGEREVVKMDGTLGSEGPKSPSPSLES